MVFLMTLRRMKRTDITVHGFRSTFLDWAAERTNFPRAVCEAALSHTLRNETLATYHRTDLFERRRVLLHRRQHVRVDPEGYLDPFVALATKPPSMECDLG